MNRDRGLWWAYEVQRLPDPVRMLAVIEISLSLSLSLLLSLSLSLQCSAIWQVSISIDSILICPGLTSLVLCNYT